MSEAEKIQAAEANLRKLAARLNRGWRVLHPVRESLLEKVRAAVRQEQSKQHKTTSKSHAAREIARRKGQTLHSSKPKSATKQKSKSQSKDRSQSL